MKNIVLFCGAGLSTSMLANRIEDAAQKIGFKCTVEAYQLGQASVVGPTADIILLGPQVRNRINEIKELCPGILVEVIDIRVYGMMDGEAVIKRVKEAIGE